MARRTGAGSRGGRIVTRKITRGPRKGQTVRGYIGRSGKFIPVKAGSNKMGGQTVGKQKTAARLTGKTSTGAKGSKRAGLTGLVLKDAKGRKIHRYTINGKVQDVVVKPKKKSRDEQLSLRKKKKARSGK